MVQQKQCVIALLIGLFREDSCIFYGWHMDKDHWLTVGNEKIRFLADMSYELTK